MQSASVSVRNWLIVIAAMILFMIAIGALTRLTESGLSMVEWRPVTGTLPPLSHAAWEEEFAKYRLTPQYERVNAGMSLGDFQTIYWWEWGHRFLGRLIGAVFLVPFLVFWARGFFTRAGLVRLGALFALGGAQGAIGWWMVASGLVDRVDVSPIRLTIHLLIACVLFIATVRLLLDLAPRPERDPQAVLPTRAPAWLARGFLIAVFAQIGLGALVAGIDAGLSHDTWPLMDGHFIPPATDLWAMAPAWLNHLDNALTVQWQHRMGGYVVVALALWQALALERTASGTTAARGAWVLFELTLAQAALGVGLLFWQVPLVAALLHQGLAMGILALATAQTWLAPLPARARPAEAPLMSGRG